MELLTKTHAHDIHGVLSCYDRIVINGTLMGLCYAEGMTSYLYAKNIRIFDFATFAQGLRDKLIENAQTIARENNIEIEYIRKNNFRKEDRVKRIIEQRGNHPGMVHIFSALEPCSTYMPWHDKKTHKTFLKNDSGKCLHYYFYFIDPALGLCYVRLPTWVPFRLQIYFNGHNLLASKLARKKIPFTLIDNVFTHIANCSKAQELSDEFSVELLHSTLNRFARSFCPITTELNSSYHWSIMQIEYATDIIFKKQESLHAIYDALVRTAVHTVKPDSIATFLGRKLHPLYQQQLGNNFDTRIMGTRIKHTMGPVSIKMYDKLALVLRIETTVNDVSFFSHYRTVDQRNGDSVSKYAPMKKSIYSIPALSEQLLAANNRYLAFISSISDRSNGIQHAFKLSQPAPDKGRSSKGFNMFDNNDLDILLAVARGEHTISGFQNKNIRAKLPAKSSAQVSRIIARLRTHGLIKLIGRTYKYYLTAFGKIVITAALKLKELFLIPQLSLPLPS